MRGESQKPVTDGYRDNWEAIFNKSKKATPVKTEPCPECYPGKPGKRLIDADGFACFERCSYCGGEGVIPLET